jgi:hypothetical protein
MKLADKIKSGLTEGGPARSDGWTASDPLKVLFMEQRMLRKRRRGNKAGVDDTLIPEHLRDKVVFTSDGRQVEFDMSSIPTARNSDRAFSEVSKRFKCAIHSFVHRNPDTGEEHEMSTPEAWGKFVEEWRNGRQHRVSNKTRARVKDCVEKVGSDDASARFKGVDELWNLAALTDTHQFFIEEVLEVLVKALRPVVVEGSRQGGSMQLDQVQWYAAGALWVFTSKGHVGYNVLPALIDTIIEPILPPAADEVAEDVDGGGGGAEDNGDVAQRKVAGEGAAAEGAGDGGGDGEGGDGEDGGVGAREKFRKTMQTRYLDQGLECIAGLMNMLATHATAKRCLVPPQVCRALLELVRLGSFSALQAVCNIIVNENATRTRAIKGSSHAHLRTMLTCNDLQSASNGTAVALLTKLILACSSDPTETESKRKRRLEHEYERGDLISLSEGGAKAAAGSSELEMLAISLLGMFARSVLSREHLGNVAVLNALLARLQAVSVAVAHAIENGLAKAENVMSPEQVQARQKQKVCRQRRTMRRTKLLQQLAPAVESENTDGMTLKNISQSLTRLGVDPILRHHLVGARLHVGYKKLQQLQQHLLLALHGVAAALSKRWRALNERRVEALEQVTHREMYRLRLGGEGGWADEPQFAEASQADDAGRQMMGLLDGFVGTRAEQEAAHEAANNGRAARDVAIAKMEAKVEMNNSGGGGHDAKGSSLSDLKKAVEENEAEVARLEEIEEDARNEALRATPYLLIQATVGAVGAQAQPFSKQSHCSSTATIYASSIIRSIAHSPAAATLAQVSGFLGCVCALLRHPQACVRLHGLSTIRGLAKEEDDRKRLVRTGVLRKLVELVDEQVVQEVDAAANSGSGPRRNSQRRGSDGRLLVPALSPAGGAVQWAQGEEGIRIPTSPGKSGPLDTPPAVLTAGKAERLQRIAAIMSVSALPMDQIEEIPDSVSSKGVRALVKLLSGRGGDNGLPITLGFIPELRLLAASLWALSRRRSAAVQAIKMGANEAICGWIGMLMCSDPKMAVDWELSHLDDDNGSSGGLLAKGRASQKVGFAFCILPNRRDHKRRCANFNNLRNQRDKPICVNSDMRLIHLLIASSTYPFVLCTSLFSSPPPPFLPSTPHSSPPPPFLPPPGPGGKTGSCS